MKEVKGNVLNSKVDIVVHCTNCFGVMGAGIAKQIKEKFPKVFKDYKKLCDSYKGRREELLGTCQFVRVKNEGRRLTICNLFGQFDFGFDRKPKLIYDAFQNGLNSLFTYAFDNSLESIAFPWKIGCGYAGGDWARVSKMIEEKFMDSHFDIEIWKL